jgi:uncharacterized protein YndB with AHSA1/START domain
MLKTIAIAAAVVAAGLLVYAATKPDTFRVQRAATIKAPPEKIFVLVNDFRKWGAWSPYEKKDPTMKRTLSGAEQGRGAVYAWEGNGEVGVGRMEIAESSAPTTVRIRLDFTRPFETSNIVEFTMEPRGDATRVTWDMNGPAPFVSKVMQVFFSMDHMVGKDFESGLANLKAVAEKG